MGNEPGPHLTETIDFQQEPKHEDRVSKLLGDLEKQSQDHIKQINDLHGQYRHYVNRTKELEEKCKAYQKDAQMAIESERIQRKELKRLMLQNDSLIRRVTTTKHGAKETILSGGQGS
jgi:TolA-binding protein